MSTPSRGTQVSLVQLDNYGPWTVSPTPRRETDLQSLQARLYADFADFVGDHDGYAFFDRFDNMVGVTNGVDERSHARLQERVRNRYPLTVSVGVGRARAPLDALEEATRRLQAAGSAQDPDRSEILAVGDGPEPTWDVTVAHFDVVDVTRTYTDRRTAAESTRVMRRATLELSSYLAEEHDSIARFVGGDNVIAVCPPIETGAVEAAREQVRSSLDVDLQVGVGRGRTAHEAGHRAKVALERCRESGQRTVRADGHTRREQ